jgi:hypothetical protein
MYAMATVRESIRAVCLPGFLLLILKQISRMRKSKLAKNDSSVITSQMGAIIGPNPTSAWISKKYENLPDQWAYHHD